MCSVSLVLVNDYRGKDGRDAHAPVVQVSVHRLGSNASGVDSQTGTLRPAPSSPPGPADPGWLGDRAHRLAEAQQQQRQGRESTDLVFAARRVPPPPGQRLSVDSALARVKMHQTLTVRSQSTRLPCKGTSSALASCSVQLVVQASSHVIEVAERNKTFQSIFASYRS